MLSLDWPSRLAQSFRRPFETKCIKSSTARRGREKTRKKYCTRETSRERFFIVEHREPERKRSWRGLFHSVHHQSLPLGQRRPLSMRHWSDSKKNLLIRSKSALPAATLRPTSQQCFFFLGGRGLAVLLLSFLHHEKLLLYFSSSSSPTTGITRRERKRLAGWTEANPKTSGNEDGSALRGFVRSAL